LDEVSALLVKIQELVVEAANTGGMSEEEIAANQLEVDSAIESITRISNSTEFSGLNLLDGSLGYTTSGVNTTDINDLDITSVQFGSRDYVGVNVDITQAATKATLTYPNSVANMSGTIRVTGSDGVITIAVNSAMSVTDIMSAINAQTDATGVTCVYANGSTVASGISFLASDYGSGNFVKVEGLNSQQFDVYDYSKSLITPVTSTSGVDVSATINGNLVKGDGLTLNLNTLGLDLSFNVNESFNVAGGTTDFTITGGGASFQIGASVTTNQQVNIGITSVAASELGNAIDGYLSDLMSDGKYNLADDPAQASVIVENAITEISELRGRLGAFESNVLDTTVNSLEITVENITASESNIRDTDFAAETANMTRAQILVEAGTSVLKTSNTTAQSILSLLQ
jgi:flagellin